MDRIKSSPRVIRKRIFFPLDHYDKEYREWVFPFLKPFIKPPGFTDAERILLYAVSDKDFHFVSSVDKANIAILPMAWNYYVLTKKMKLAKEFVKGMAKHNIPVLIYNGGDYGFTIPKFSNTYVFWNGGYKTRFDAKDHVLPAFIGDPIKKFYNMDAISFIPFSEKPIIGFCGMALSSSTNALKEVSRVLLRNIKHYLGFNPLQPQTVMSSSKLRADMLKKFADSNEVTANFIYRDQYRAGVTEKKESHKTTIEFYDNLKESAYILCVRGSGNFSVRFYEALAMGRIPVLIDTDCGLPLEDLIEWEQHIVKISKSERRVAVEKVVAFHAALGPEGFRELQEENRKLWEEKLRYGGYFKNFLNFYFNE